MDMNIVGWIVIGFLAGSISGWFVGTRSAQGCLPTIVVGIIGAIIGGWLAAQLGLGHRARVHRRADLRDDRAVVVRIVLRALETLIRADPPLRRYHR
jgi:uncharacterized membrane protein YeaQ/YmgE (transglycosylase-associated protein family)